MYLFTNSKISQQTVYVLSSYSNFNKKQFTISGRELSAIEEPTCTSQNRLLTFQAFSEHSVKNRVFSVGEVWLKQLARIPKISQDKAEAIVQV